MNNILITSAGQRVSLVRAFSHELSKADIEGEVYTTDMNPEISAACNVAYKYFKVERVSSPEYIDNLLSLCIRNKIKMIIPTIDTELQILADSKNIFKRYEIEIVVSDPHFIRICRDKRLTNIFFKEHSVEIPKPIDKNNPTFPLFIKPYDGSLSSNIFKINKKEELTSFHLYNEKLMFMELIDSNIFDEYTVDMYYGKDHKVKCIIPRKRMAVRSGEIHKGVTCKNEIVPFLKKHFNYIEGAIGCLTTQLFYSVKERRIVGIEINPRFGGGFPLSYKANGNYPKWLIDEYLLSKEITYTDGWEDKLLMLRYDDEILVHGYKD